MSWATADLVSIDPRETVIYFTVLFSRDDGPQQAKQQFEARLDRDSVSANWLAQQVTDYINKLNGIDVAKAIQLGPITLNVPPVVVPNPERDAYFALLNRFQQLGSQFGGMSQVDAAKPDRDALKKQLEDGYKKEYFGL